MTSVFHFRYLPAAFMLVAVTLLYMGCSEESESPQISEDEVSASASGVLHIKWEPDAVEVLESLDSMDRLAWVQARLPQVQVTSAGRLFAPAGRFEARTRAAGLHQWYEVHYTAGEAVTRTVSGTLSDALYVETPAKLQIPVLQSAPADIQPTLTRSRPGFNDPLLSNQWYLANDGTQTVAAQSGFDLDLPDVWPVQQGVSEVVVAVFDTGVDPSHPDLAGAMWCNEAERDGLPGVDDDGNGYVDDVHGYNFFDMSPVQSADNHATHVAGLIGAVNNNAVGISSVAGGDGTPGSGVRIMSCQIMKDKQESSYDDMICKAFKYAADNGAVICSNSWSHIDHESMPLQSMPQAEREAMDYFITYAGVDEHGVQTGPMRGGLVIFAAGNYGDSNPVYPSACEEVLAVTSLSSSGRVPAYASYGEWVDLCAYGGDGDGSVFDMVLSTGADSKYLYMNGTSMAAPQAAAVAALVLQQRGGEGYTPDRLKEQLLHTHDRAFDYNPAFRDQIGAGALSVRMALSDFPAGWHAPEAPHLTVRDTGYTSLTLAWHPVCDAAGRPVTKYRVYWHPAGQPDLVKMAVSRLLVPASSKTDIIYVVSGLSQGVMYEVSVVAVDSWQQHSPEAGCSAPTRQAGPPVLRCFLPSYCAVQTGLETQVRLDTCFSCVQPLKYAVHLSVPDVVNADVTGEVLTVRTIGYGRTELTLTATDEDNHAAKASCSIVVRHADRLADVWPNPATDVVYVAAGSPLHMTVRIADTRGETLLSTSQFTDVFSPVDIDVSRLATGLYRLSVETDTESFETTLLKR